MKQFLFQKNYWFLFPYWVHLFCVEQNCCSKFGLWLEKADGGQILLNQLHRHWIILIVKKHYLSFKTMGVWAVGQSSLPAMYSGSEVVSKNDTGHKQVKNRAIYSYRLYNLTAIFILTSVKTSSNVKFILRLLGYIY